ncbi:hypothetical protein [Corynebacterium pilosum]|uniref:hypothetical protein n=1 Tax=Corynebacterium pilosum TaxID=35756 RepID=UPI001F21FF1C|nr:hypothetical protein [Corynebacterium pilosum]
MGSGRLSGSLIGPVFAGAVVDGAGWRATFVAQVAFGIVALGLAFAWVPRLSTTPARIDAPSVIVSLLGLGGVVYGIQYGSWAAVIVGTLALLVFFWLQRSGGDQALLPLGLFANRNFTLARWGSPRWVLPWRRSSSPSCIGCRTAAASTRSLRGC